ncbi:hypothetical protein CspeluHIS016_0901830 [Cutaneotrichosporon spelunceum]|uniref:Uncharacterized protein n=1 Tax=Cutaneotrichosporon spelunceum TaxID=1672016 RepID=A0AAD3TZX7_9TREE|nr:hypothetical protein CspeluHIS016_0901830 [Cutaneotrichosporon spelunceum]
MIYTSLLALLVAAALRLEPAGAFTLTVTLALTLAINFATIPLIVVDSITRPIAIIIAITRPIATITLRLANIPPSRHPPPLIAVPLPLALFPFVALLPVAQVTLGIVLGMTFRQHGVNAWQNSQNIHLRTQYSHVALGSEAY